MHAIADEYGNFDGVSLSQDQMDNFTATQQDYRRDIQEIMTRMREEMAETQGDDEKKEPVVVNEDPYGEEAFVAEVSSGASRAGGHEPGGHKHGVVGPTPDSDEEQLLGAAAAWECRQAKVESTGQVSVVGTGTEVQSHGDEHFLQRLLVPKYKERDCLYQTC